jgi:hypothetical protein
MTLQGKWERIEVTVDSGAVETVGPEHVGKAFKVKENEMSKAGYKYVVANGEEIPNKGEKHLKGWGDTWGQLYMCMQVTDVRKVLASVGRMCDGGNRVVFDDQAGSYIMNKATGQMTPLAKKGGVYVRLLCS